MTLSSFQIHALTAITGLAIAGVYFYQKKKKNDIPVNWKEVGTVEKLILYPLKSGRRMELQNAYCTNFGLRETDEGKEFLLSDRFLIVYTEKDHEFRTARNYPKMMLIIVTTEGAYLKLDAPTMCTLYLKLPQVKVSEKVSVKYHGGEIVHTTDCGNEVAQWLSQYLLEKNTGLRLGYNNGSYKRDITTIYKPVLNYYKHLSNSSTGLYSDLSSLLLLNQKSIEDLNTRLTSSCITANNFRPNIIIDGPHLEPYIEDDWDWIKIGDVVVRNVKDCTRCIMTTVDPETGIRSTDREPLKTLETYRLSKGPMKKTIMGINLGIRKCGLIAVGDKVFIPVK